MTTETMVELENNVRAVLLRIGAESTEGLTAGQGRVLFEASFKLQQSADLFLRLREMQEDANAGAVIP